MVKPRLTRIVEELFAIGGNYDLAKYMEVRRKLVEFLQEEDHVILSDDDKNIRLAKDLIRFIDADIVYARETDNREVYSHIKSFLKRMMDKAESSNWNYDELRLLVSSIHMTESIEQAETLFSKANAGIIAFKRRRLTHYLEGALVCNMIARILDAKHFDDDVTINLADKFSSMVIWLENLVDNHKNSKYLEMLWQVTKVRRAIFNKDSNGIFELCDSLAQYDERLKQMMINEVDSYLAD